MSYANKGADQPALLRNMISTFVYHSLDSITPLLADKKFQDLLASVDEQAGLSNMIVKSWRQVFLWLGSNIDWDDGH